MSLQSHNPFDFGWFGSGLPVDHLASRRRSCPSCQKETDHECYCVIVGSLFEFQATFFMRPFLDYPTTKHKVKCTTGTLAEKTNRKSSWPLNESDSP